MKLGRYIVYGILTFLIGILTTYFLVFIFYQTGGGELTSNTFNSGILALVSSILFLCAIILTSTLMLINAISNKK